MAILDNIPGWKVFSAGVGIAALCVLGYFGYQWFLASPSDLKTLEEQATKHALDQLAQVYEAKVREQGEQRIVVMPVLRDTSNEQTRDMLLRRLNSIEGVKADKPRDPTLDERAGILIRSLVNKEEKPPDPNRVFEQAGEVDEVVSVSVAKRSSTADSGVCDLDVYRIVRADTPERMPSAIGPERIKGLSGTARVDAPAEDSGPGFWASLWAFLWRMLAVLATAALLPFLCWPAIRAAFKADSNAINACVLAALTVLDLVAVFAFAGFAFTTTAVVSAGLLVPAALLYNFRMMTFIEER